MTDRERAVAQYYGNADLWSRMCAALEAAGVDLNRLQPEDVAPLDEFHVGGRLATAYAVSKMALSPRHHVLDVGCGIGGAARYIAGEIGCKVTGIDLTPEFIDVARTIDVHLGLEGTIAFEVASALDMPFDDAVFDAAITIHVAMNIADRAGLYREIARVLKPGAVFCLFDIMRTGDGPLTFPLPWASTEETSHLTTAAETRALLEEAGLAVDEVEDRSPIARSFFSQTADAGLPPLGPHVLMGAEALVRLGNVRKGVQAGRIGPVQIVAHRTR